MTTFTVEGLDHVHVQVRDRQAAADWYARVLGLVRAPVGAEWARDPSGPLFLSTPDGGHCLALFAHAPSTEGDHTVAFRVTGPAFADFLDRVEALGLVDRQGREVTRGDAVDHGAARSIYFCDPDGNRIEITTYERAPAPAALGG